MTHAGHLIRVTTGALLCAAALAGCGEDAAPTAPPDGGGPDRTPPVRISGPSLTYADTSGAAVLTWSAPSDAPGGDSVDRYEIRYAYSFPLNWDLSITAPDPPAPAAPGEIERYTIEQPLRGRDLYAAIRSYDVAGNVSDVSDIAHAHVTGWNLSAEFHDVLTTDPIAGLQVIVTGRHVQTLLTDAGGRATAGDLSSGSVNLSIGAYPAGPLYHGISRTFVLDTHDVDESFPMIEYQPVDKGGFTNLLGMFIDAATGVDNDRVFRKYKVFPVPVYIPEFTNSYGNDYAALTRQALDQWELRCGVDLWVEVASPPALGVEWRFLPPAQMGGQNGITIRDDGPDGYPQTDVVKVIDTVPDPVQLYRILLHEAGHTIRLNHLPAGFMMYAGQPLPDDVTDEEAAVVRLHAALPNGIDLSGYDVNAPPP